MRRRDSARGLLVLLVGCASLGCSADKAGNDGSVTSDRTAVDRLIGLDVSLDGARDGQAGDAGPQACPGAPAYQGDSAWTYQVTAASGVVFCTYGGSSKADLKTILESNRQLRFVPGTYALPAQTGTFSLTLPICLSDRAGQTSTSAGPGTLTVSPVSTSITAYALAQPFTLASKAWTVTLRADLFQKPGKPLPPLILDQELRRGTNPDSELQYQLCPGSECSTNRLFVGPCGGTGSSETDRITFDRGEATFEVTGFDGMGPQNPAALVRASGKLDGVTFAQTQYYKLAHQPDHHNLGGGFLVLFDQPIGGSCGLKAQVPSPHGSYVYQKLEAWTVDCNAEVLEALAGVTSVPRP